MCRAAVSSSGIGQTGETRHQTMQDIFEGEVRRHRFTTCFDVAANVFCPCAHTLRNVVLILVSYIVSLPLVHVCAHHKMQKEMGRKSACATNSSTNTATLNNRPTVVSARTQFRPWYDNSISKSPLETASCSLTRHHSSPVSRYEPPRSYTSILRSNTSWQLTDTTSETNHCDCLSCRQATQILVAITKNHCPHCGGGGGLRDMPASVEESEGRLSGGSIDMGTEPCPVSW